MLLAVSYKVVYDIAYFEARALEEAKYAGGPVAPSKLTLESAQRIITGALKEDPNNLKTIVTRVLQDDYKLSTVIIEVNKQRKIGWIIEMRLFFSGDLFDHDGHNLTQGYEKQYEIHLGELPSPPATPLVPENIIPNEVLPVPN